MKLSVKEVNITRSVKEHFIVLLIILIGSVLRVWNYWDWSFTNDELSALNRLNFESFSDLINFGVKIDGHPAFVQVLLFYWSKLFGVSELNIRLPFVLAGIGSIFYMYKLSCKWLGYQRAILSTIIFSFSQLFILYSQIGRPYAMGIFFVLGFALYWTSFIKDLSVSSKQIFLLIIFGTLSLLTHYFAGLTIAILLFTGLFRIERKLMIKYIGACLVIGILFLPHLFITLNHLSLGGVGWLPEPEWNFLMLFFYELFNNKIVFLLLIAFFFLYGFFTKGTRIFEKSTSLLLALFFIPYFIAFFYSIHISPLLQFSVLLFFAPFLILGIVSLIPETTNTKVFYGGCLVISAFLISQYSFINEKPFANYKRVIQESIHLENEFDDKDLISIGNFTDSSYAQYYIDRLSSHYQFDYLNINKQAISILHNDLKKSHSKYLMVAFANQPLLHEFHETIKHYFPTIVERKRFFNSELILYSRQAKQRAFSFQTNFEESNDKWAINKNLNQDSMFYSPPIAHIIKPKTKYALTYKNNVYELFKDNNFLTVSCLFKSDDSTEISIITTVKRKGESIFWNAQPFKKNWSESGWSFACSVLEKTKEFKPDDEVYVYLWNPKGDEAFVDDFRISNYIDSDYNYYEF